MTGKISSQGRNDRSRVVGWSKQASERLKTAVKLYGSQAAVAEAAGTARQSLVEILAGRATPTYATLDALCSVLRVSRDQIIGDIGNADVPDVIVPIPALKVKAAAGDGSLANDDRVAPGPFHMAEDWLRKKFGSLTGLRLVQVKGDSLVPELHEGDWVLIDQNRNTMENGLAVLLLDDCLMIKFLQRDGYTLHLISRNPNYRPTILDLRQDEDRLRVIGKAVYCFKAV